MGQTIYQVDAFTDQPFSGNPAGVCVLAEAAPASWMQAVASEMNLAETAFLWPEADGYRLRWFTPTTEVDLCGHATLASAHILWEHHYLPQDNVARFMTRSGLLTAIKGSSADWITMDFPASRYEAVPPPPHLLSALGIESAKDVDVFRTDFDYMVVLKSEEKVRSIVSDFAVLKTIPTRGVLVTAAAEQGPYDFVSRFFAPAAGIDEDPVTGSAHCALGPYWQARLDKNPLVGYQASRRGGVVRVETAGPRILLGGQAITVLKGELSY